MKMFRNWYSRFMVARIRNKFLSCGASVEIVNPIAIAHPENITIGAFVYIGPLASIWAGGGVSIGSNVILGPRLTIHTSNHNYESGDMLPYGADSILKKVTIDDHVWVGDQVMICPGVTIHEGAIVAMGSVVTKDVPFCAVVGGNPARIIKFRDKERFERLKSDGAFYLRYKYAETR